MSTDNEELALSLDLRDRKLKIPRIVKLSLPLGSGAAIFGGILQLLNSGVDATRDWLVPAVLFIIALGLLFAWRHVIKVEEPLPEREIEITQVHKIVQDLSDGMGRLSNARSGTRNDYYALERKIVHSAAANLEKFFRTLVNYECKVTVKLLYEENNHIRLARVFVRSLEPCPRDDNFDKPAVVGTGANIGLDRALDRRPDGVCYYMCNNLAEAKAKKEYSNHRPEWEALYNATIVVPIASKDYSACLGFLCVDTLRSNSFRDSHVRVLAMIASLLYVYFDVFRHYAPEESVETSTIGKATSITEPSKEGTHQ